jgi:O-antigen/teichoic acid export membrane protein|tara:strand:+ start:1352 stop:2713 length:1362 start_codon:yes stop_codon:yes gene_type:complete
MVAREISLTDFGIASALAATLALVEMASAVAIDKLLLQDSEGDSDLMLSSAHTLSIIRGVLLAAILYFSAWPITHIFNLQETLWAFQLLALLPLISGFIHFDFVTKQRQMNIFPTSINIVVPQVLATALVIPALHYLPDYRAMLLVIIAIPVFNLLISHMTATRRYKLSLDYGILLKMLTFAWPLMISGLLMFTIFQGDKVIIGGYYDMATLGLYSVVFSSLLLPTMILHRLYNAMALPLIARSFHSQVDFQTHSSIIVSSTIVLCAITSAVFLILGPTLLILIFGEKFTGSLVILPWIALMLSVRVLRIAPSVITLAMAEPRCELYANLARTIAIPLSLIAVYQDWPIYSIAIMGFVGEICALITAYTLLKVPFSRRSLVAPMRNSLLLLVLFVSMAFFYSQLSLGIAGLATMVAAAVVLAAVFITLCLMVYRSVPDLSNLINEFNTTPHRI